MDYRQADTSTLVTIGHLAVAFVLTYLLGLERTLRGAAAGNRTFSMIGVGAALVAVLALDGAPNALAGVVTGVGFIGGAWSSARAAPRATSSTGSPPPERSSPRPRSERPPARGASPWPSRRRPS
ncbi:MgtC/SapB family protein [Streptomyces sp. NBC_01264]|uniref:MgtC/SapB family protein n=1 Tax=Streptomyces sp. NBC_01264 TaxID=2903804 RepID=UPI002253978E|nr:MgtC/SapB family protein [Streptomyces sp. NBC_01264]MCX4783505.1 MgtC/SapB family protein [Streptomyces sp. NBC_01264]